MQRQNEQPDVDASSPDYSRPWIFWRGELNVIDYTLESGIPLEETQRRVIGIHIQIVICICLLSFFFRLLLRSISLLRKPHKTRFAQYIACLQAGIGFITFSVFLSSIIPNGLGCRWMVWIGMFALWTSSVLIHIYLLEKAYLVTKRTRTLIIGALLLAPTPVYLYLGIWHGFADITDNALCISVYPILQPLYKLLMDTAINVVLSTIFINVVLVQYRRFGRDAWKRLADDGIVTMLAVVGSNFIAAVCVCLNVFGSLSQYMHYIDRKLTFVCRLLHILIVIDTHHIVSSLYHNASNDSSGRAICSNNSNEACTSTSGSTCGYTQQPPT
jgi:hypothetical protein